MKKYDKLVRDRIPEIIELSGSKCNFHVATKEEFKSRLIDKLGEEIAEFVENPSAEEMADILEVLDAVRRVYGIDLSDIKHQKVMKRVNRGGFEKKIVLESTVDVKSVEKYRDD